MLKHALRGKRHRSNERKERKPTADTTEKKLDNEGKITVQHKSSEDDYGFLIPKGRRTPIITVRAQSPRQQVDYLDQGLLDTAFVQTPRENQIPVSFGVIKPELETSEEFLLQPPEFPSPSPIPTDDDSLYINIDRDDSLFITNNNEELNPDIPKDYYEEKMESHYARLTEVRPSGHTGPTSTRRTEDFQFYQTHLHEVRARSRSRTRCRSRSRGRERTPGRSASRGRSCSKSRDIVELYTKRPISGTRVRDQSNSPERNQCRGRQSSNNHSIQPSNIQKPKDRDLKAVCLLEMDPKRNAEIDRELNLATSVKPAAVKMMMIASHQPSQEWKSTDEIAICAGEMVTGLYKQNDWLSVMTSTNQRGFVPYAYTKPVKITTGERPKKPKRLNPRPKTTPDIVVNNAKPITGILKNSSNSRMRQRKATPKYSVKVRTSVMDDNNSVSSESSILHDDYVYTRSKNTNKASSHADCIVVDVDDSNSFDYPSTNNTSEDHGTYCSDSGISDPSSNHSDDIDLLNSPTGYPNNMHFEQKIINSISSPRQPNERIVSVTKHSLDSHRPCQPQPHQRHYETITQMPLGPLGARLAQMNLREKQPAPSRQAPMNNDMKDRAKSSNMPQSLRPEIPKDYGGPRVTVVYDYSADNEDDLQVKASDIVTVLNSEDIEWIWVQRRDGKEGFIPREYVIPLELAHSNRRQVPLVSSL